MAPGQSPQALLTMLDRATDRLCRAGAAVKNLAHSASLHAREKIAPSKPGTEHLALHQQYPSAGPRGGGDGGYGAGHATAADQHVRRHVEGCLRASAPFVRNTH